MDGRFAAALAGVVLLALVVGVIAGQSQSGIVAAPSPTVAPSPVPAPGPDEVIVKPVKGGAVFEPAVLTVKVGARVTWINYDTIAHAVAADDGRFSSSPFGPGQTYHWTATPAGRVPYGDYIDPNLHGVIVVQP